MASAPARPSSTPRCELFADKGYFGTSLRDVATAVGVRESALYNYFKSKEALFDALILAHEHTKTRAAGLAGRRRTDRRRAAPCSSASRSAASRAFSIRANRCCFAC